MLITGVTSTEWERARQTCIASSGGTCYLCHEPLQPNARSRSRWSTEVDHKVPLDAVSHLDLQTQRFYALDQSNLGAAHKRCNVLKSARQPLTVGATTSAPYEPRIQSQDW